MKLENEQIEAVVAFWMYCLPNGISKSIFHANLEKYLSNTKSSEIKLQVNFEPTWILGLLINGGIEYGIEYENANPYKVLLEWKVGLEWPAYGVVDPYIITRIEKYNSEISIEALIEKHSLYSKLDEKFISYIKQQKNRLRQISFQFQNESPSSWYRQSPSVALISPEKYKKICALAIQLEREIDSIWPLPNKDRKKIELIALRKLLINLNEHPYKHLELHVKDIKETYPEIHQGYIFQRVPELFDQLLEPEIKERSSSKLSSVKN